MLEYWPNLFTLLFFIVMNRRQEEVEVGRWVLVTRRPFPTSPGEDWRRRGTPCFVFCRQQPQHLYRQRHFWAITFTNALQRSLSVVISKLHPDYGRCLILISVDLDSNTWGCSFFTLLRPSVIAAARDTACRSPLLPLQLYQSA